MLEDFSFGTIEGSKIPLKSVISAITPILIFLLIIVIWSIGFAIFWKYKKYFRKCVLTSIITVMLLLHPTLTESAFTLYLCKDLDDAGVRLEADLSIECWTNSHYTWSLLIGIPILIVWVIGMPVTAFILLFINKKRLDERRVMD